MQTDSPPSFVRRLTAAVCVSLLLAGCTSGGDTAQPEPTGSADAVLAAREALGSPMVRLAEAGIQLGDNLATARYEVERGPEMQDVLRDLSGDVDAVIDAAEAAGSAADGAPVEQAAGIVRDAAGRARNAAAAAHAEIAYLLRVSRIDAALLDVAGLWDQPGSQSEIRARLDGATGDATRLRRRARKVRPAPRACRVMKANRVEWARTVRTRTQRLQGQANSAGGGDFDELRSAFRRLPLGVEPRSADQAERECWRAESTVWRSREQLRGDVEALEAALQ